MNRSAFNREKWLEWCAQRNAETHREYSRVVSHIIQTDFQRGLDDALHHRGRNCPRDSRKAYDDYNQGYKAGTAQATESGGKGTSSR